MTTQHRQEKLLVIGQMAAAIAHDFNNLLMVIQCDSRTLHDALQSHPLAHHAARIMSAAERAGRMTRRLLNYTGRAPGDDETAVISVHVALAEILSISEPLLRRTRWVTTLNAGDDRVQIVSDRFDQVVMNLLCNACDAMPDGGLLILSTRNVTRTSPTTRENAPFLMVEVIDTGVGMSAELQARVFEPFFTTKAPGRGTGLGLATVLDIVESAGGYVEFESVERVGTTFRVLLPVHRA